MSATTAAVEPPPRSTSDLRVDHPDRPLYRVSTLLRPLMALPVVLLRGLLGCVGRRRRPSGARLKENVCGRPVAASPPSYLRARRYVDAYERRTNRLGEPSDLRDSLLRPDRLRGPARTVR